MTESCWRHHNAQSWAVLALEPRVFAWWVKHLCGQCADDLHVHKSVVRVCSVYVSTKLAVEMTWLKACFDPDVGARKNYCVQYSWCVSACEQAEEGKKENNVTVQTPVSAQRTFCQLLKLRMETLVSSSQSSVPPSDVQFKLPWERLRSWSIQKIREETCWQILCSCCMSKLVWACLITSMYFNGTRNDSSRGAHGLPAVISKGSPSPSLQKHAWFWMEQIAQHSSGSQLCVESWRVIEICVTVQIRLYFARTQHSRTFLDGGNCGTMAGSPTRRPCRSSSCPNSWCSNFTRGQESRRNSIWWTGWNWTVNVLRIINSTFLQYVPCCYCSPDNIHVLEWNGFSRLTTWCWQNKVSQICSKNHVSRPWCLCVFAMPGPSFSSPWEHQLISSTKFEWDRSVTIRTYFFEVPLLFLRIFDVDVWRSVSASATSRTPVQPLSTFKPHPITKYLCGLLSWIDEACFCCGNWMVNIFDPEAMIEPRSGVSYLLSYRGQ